MARSIAARLLAAALAGGALSAMPAAVRSAAAQQQALSFDMPEQSLSAALVEFSRRSGMVVVAPAHLVAGKRAPAVRGLFTPDAALGRLLVRSGLEPRQRPEGGLTLVASAAASTSTAQRAPAPPPAASEEPPIVVTGQRLTRMTQDYASALSGPLASVEQIPRWNTRLCPSVAGLERTAAQSLIDHIARRAQDVGLTADGAGCQPNVVIIFTADPAIIARRIVDTRQDLLGYLFSEETVTAGREALENFANTPRAVRWWQVARRSMADGEPLADSTPVLPTPSTENSFGGGGTLPGGAELGGLRGVDTVRSQGTRMRSNTRQDLNFVLIIVDSGLVAGVSQQAAADYLAMATLAPIDPRADLSSFDSVLNLFEGRAQGHHAPAMTIWDLAYLQSLYAARPDAPSVRQHNAEIARRMAEQIQSISNGEAP